MIRKIIQIDEKKCNGCGLCVTACHEGAIEIIDGVAKLISDKYCDGLGNCLPNCPTGAIEIIEREAADFDEEAVKMLLEEKKEKFSKFQKPISSGCAGTAAKKIKRNPAPPAFGFNLNKWSENNSISELRQWPVQLRLVNSSASYLQGADLLVAADCTAYAYANFHNDFIKDHITVIGCPKLDDNEYYKEKLTDIIKNCSLKSITVVRMEVPCCGGIVNAVKTAMTQAGEQVTYKEVIISTDGRLL